MPSVRVPYSRVEGERDISTERILLLIVAVSLGQSLRRTLLQKLLGFVDLRRKIRAPASVRVVEQH